MDKQEKIEYLTILAALASAYSLMLKVPATNKLRVENQEVYAQVRDAIALATKEDPETVQNRFEEDA